MEAALVHTLVSLLTLTLLEIILGVDNLVFIAVASARLPVHQQQMGRRLGLVFALVTRLVLLASAVWLIGLTKPLFVLLSQPFSIRDVLLIVGGVFLIFKATQEIHIAMETTVQEAAKQGPANLIGVILQIGILDIIFSLDSVFTAVGLTQQYWIMATAIFIAILTMIFLSEPLCSFIERKPTIKMLALSFLVLIGVFLIADGFGFHIPREYLYFAICFSIFVEVLNTFTRRKR